MNTAHAPPKKRQFYLIQYEDDGTCTVFLQPDVTTYDAEGVKEYDVKVRIVRGVIPYDGLEEDIRARFSAWCELGEEVNL